MQPLSMPSFQSNRSNGKRGLRWVWIEIFVGFLLPVFLYYSIVAFFVRVFIAVRLVRNIFFLIWLYRAEKNLKKVSKDDFPRKFHAFLGLLPVVGFLHSTRLIRRLSVSFSVQQKGLDMRIVSKQVNTASLGCSEAFYFVGFVSCGYGLLFYFFADASDFTYYNLPFFRIQIIISIISFVVSEISFAFAFKEVLKQEKAVEKLWNDISTGEHCPYEADSEIGQFCDAYSFEDPSRAYDIWVNLSTRAKAWIAQTNPQAVDVMRQVDQEMKLIEQEQEVLFCTNCGKQLPKDIRFCLYCGNPVISSHGSTVTIVGYKEYVMSQLSVKVYIRGEKIGEVGYNEMITVRIDYPCKLIFEYNYHTTECYVNGGEWVQLSIDTIGYCSATVTDERNHQNVISNQMERQTNMWLWTVVWIILITIICFNFLNVFR